MYSSFEAVAEGIGAQQDATVNAQVSTACFAIFMVGAILPLQKAWVDQLNQDANTYIEDTLRMSGPEVPPDPTQPGYPHNGSGPCMAAVCAIDNQEKTMDTNASDLETGSANNLVSCAKAQEEYLGSSLDMVFGLQQPLFDIMNQVKSLIRNL